MQADFYHYIYKYIHINIYMLGHRPTFFDKAFVSHLWLICCGDFVMHRVTPTGLAAAGGLCRPMLLSGKCIFKIVLVSDKWITSAVCMLVGICYVSFYTMSVEVRGSPDSKQCALSGSDHNLHVIVTIITVKRAVMLLENWPWRWTWGRWRGRHDSPDSWTSASCCG